MRFQLRPILPLLIAGLPALAGGCIEAVIDTDCVDTVDRSFEVQTPADVPLQFKIDSCRVDVEACTELCRLTMERNNINDTPTRCQVRFDGSAVDVKVWYEVYIGGSNCPTESDPVFAAPPPPSPSPSPDLGTADLTSASLELSPRGLSTRTFDSPWDSLWSHGGRTCHA